MSNYVVYDVFTDKAFGGNPLAVVTDAEGLAENNLQKIAREFNFSETTFVYPPTNQDAHARVRIFTPTQEIPFAGHPTVGTAVALHALGRVPTDMILELKIGPIPVNVSNGGAQFVTRVPLTTWPPLPTEAVAAAAGLDTDDIRLDRHLPLIASVGLPFAIAEVSSPDVLASARPVSEAFRAFEPNWPTETHFDLLIYVRDENKIKARMFAPLDGIPEDPATGSAAAALAAYLGQLNGASQDFDIEQGSEMGRPSLIEASVSVQDGQPVAVTISGKARKIMEGRLTI